jgi:hypothetical protein
MLHERSAGHSCAANSPGAFLRSLPFLNPSWPALYALAAGRSQPCSTRQLRQNCLPWADTHVDTLQPSSQSAVMPAAACRRSLLGNCCCVAGPGKQLRPPAAALIPMSRANSSRYNVNVNCPIETASLCGPLLLHTTACCCPLCDSSMTHAAAEGSNALCYANSCREPTTSCKTCCSCSCCCYCCSPSKTEES